MQKAKKKSTTSKYTEDGKLIRGMKIKGEKERFTADYHGQDPRVETHPGPVASEVAASVGAEAIKIDHKFPPPKTHPIFIRTWMDFIDNVSSRENFKTGHLNSLEILCDLYVDYDNLKKYIEDKGRSYKSNGRNGLTWKFYPEVAQLNTVQSQIKEYMKMLGLVLKKDHGTASGGEKSNWD